MKEFQSIIDFIKNAFGTNDFIPLHVPSFDNTEKKYLINCIESTFVSSVGQYVNDFESKMQEITGAKFAIATVNGTSALHLALHSIGVSRNDLVITQPLTFVATCNAIAYTGAEPVFVDVNETNMSLSPIALEKFLNEECMLNKDGNCIHSKSKKVIKACVPMHTFGFPCHIEEIVSLCSQWNIEVIEDAAESLGSYRNEKHTGTFGKLGVFSFNGNKIVTAGGGGCVVTDDEDLAIRLKHLSTTAKESHKWEYTHLEMGFNYRMPNLNAALVCAQLEKLDLFIANKRNLAANYSAFFKTVNIQFLTEEIGSKANYWLNTVKLSNLETRNEFLDYTNKKGVMTRPAWTLMTDLPMFVNAFQGDLTVSKSLVNKLVNIPSSVIL